MKSRSTRSRYVVAASDATVLTPPGRSRVRATTPRPLVADDRFILATRETGYRGLAAAVAEVIDNAVQAGAQRVRIIVREERELGSNQDLGGRQISIGVLDDGQGMNLDRLWTALQFGGTERFNDRSGLGRFGMGLPNSSVSVTRRLEVYSWCAPGAVYSTYLDIDEVSRHIVRGIPEPKPRALPAWVTGPVPRSGTLVIWPRCDRLEYRKASTVAEKLRSPLGRIYRRLIWSGLRVWVNDVPLQPEDPLFCHPTTHAGGATPYGHQMSYEIETPDGGNSSLVTIRFTLLPVVAWHRWSAEEKRARRIVGGAGISFVRAGREIDHGWTLFGGKRKENYDDWWRCELLFDPVLDECFGVTHSKQGVSPTPYLRGILEPDMEAAARALNAEVRSAFDGLRAEAPTSAAEDATRQDPLLPPPARQRSQGAKDGLRYRIVLAPLESQQFFDVSARAGSVLVTINTDHPFYDQLYAPVSTAKRDRRRDALECVVLGAARAYLAVSGGPGQHWARRYWAAWGDAIAAFTGGRRTP